MPEGKRIANKKKVIKYLIQKLGYKPWEIGELSPYQLQIIFEDMDEIDSKDFDFSKLPKNGQIRRSLGDE